MSQIFNPNPTIFAPVKSSKASSDYLWVTDPLESNLDGEEVDSEEPIDQDEIFGTFTLLRLPLPKINLCRSHQVYI
jgi:hypothetical protein